MKKLLSYTVIALVSTIAVSIAAPDKETLMTQEKAAWQVFKDKKPAEFKKLLHRDMMGIYAEGISGMKGELSDMKKWDMKSFALSDYTVVAIGEDTMMSSYKVEIQGTFAGRDASGTYFAGSVWSKTKDGWQGIFHTNIREATR